MEALGVKSKNANLGNITRLKIIPVADVVRIKHRHRDGAGNIVKDSQKLPGACLILKEGYRVFDVSIPAGLANFKESPADGMPGFGYRQEISSMLPDDSHTIAGQLRQYKDGEWLLVFEDAAGEVRLMGTTDTPVLMAASFSTAGVKGRNLLFGSMSINPVYTLDSYTTATIITTVDDGLASDYPV